MTQATNRNAAHDINPIFVDRWSPRAYTGEAIDDATLLSLFEAARWAPSANNSQPWRFIYAKSGSAHWNSLFSLLNENNQRWVNKAAVLIALVSKKTHVRQGDTSPSPLKNHSLDAGAAWASLAFQAYEAGWRTRAIGGFNRERAPEVLGVPEGYQVEILIAVGKQADKSVLPEDFHEREQPTPRKPLEKFVAEGKFSFTE
jgi:nitroreductase